MRHDCRRHFSFYDREKNQDSLIEKMYFQTIFRPEKKNIRKNEYDCTFELKMVMEGELICHMCIKIVIFCYCCEGDYAYLTDIGDSY